MARSASKGPPDPAAQQARKEKLTALHRTLHDQVATIRTGADWQAWLGVASRFHDYSAGNVLLIAAQQPDATRVAGYRAWQALGRQVDRGEKGIAILAPVVTRTAVKEETGPDVAADVSSRTGRADADRPEAGPAGQRQFVGFRVTYVFDVAQTSGDPLPEPPRPALLQGQAPEGLIPALEGLLASRGFTVTRGDCGTANGLTDFVAREVRVRADVDDAQAAKTLAHEAGHVLLHEPAAGTQLATGGLGATTAWCRGIAEVEAESVAYLVAAHHGSTTDGYSFPYVAGWAGAVDPHQPETVVQATADRVLRAAREVLAVTSPASPQDQQALATTARRARAGAVAAEELAAGADRLASRASQTRQALSGPAAAPAAVAAATGRQVQERASDPGPLLAAHVDAQSWFAGHVRGSWVPHYLGDRGALTALRSHWGGGHAPATWTGLVDHLASRGHPEQVVEDAGLGLRARTGGLVDRFRDRFVLPVRDPEGAVVGFIGRAAPGAGPDIPKYLNSPDTPVHHKGKLLFGLSEGQLTCPAPRWVVLVEGPMDVLAVATSGIATGARVLPVSACGTALSGQQATLLAALRPPSLLVAYDGDAAGRAAALRAFEVLPPGLQEIARDVQLRSADDPAALLAEVGPRRLAAELVIAEHPPLADAAVDARLAPHLPRLAHVEGQVAAQRDLGAYIAALAPTQVGRQITRVSDALRAPLASVNEAVLNAATAAPPAGSRAGGAAAAAASTARAAAALARTGTGASTARHLTDAAAAGSPALKAHSPRCR